MNESPKCIIIMYTDFANFLGVDVSVTLIVNYFLDLIKRRLKHGFLNLY